jgi:hypothetical protein
MCRDINCGCGQHDLIITEGRGPHHGDCCTTGYSPRRFFTHEEVVSELEEYLNGLRLEIKGVEERIAELKKEA